MTSKVHHTSPYFATKIILMAEDATPAGRIHFIFILYSFFSFSLFAIGDFVLFQEDPGWLKIWPGTGILQNLQAY